MISSQILLSLSLVVYAIILTEIAGLSRIRRIPRPVRKVYIWWIATPLVLLGLSSIFAWIDMAFAAQGDLLNSLSTFFLGASYFPLFTGSYCFVDLSR